MFVVVWDTRGYESTSPFKKKTWSAPGPGRPYDFNACMRYRRMSAASHNAAKDASKTFWGEVRLEFGLAGVPPPPPRHMGGVGSGGAHPCCTPKDWLSPGHAATGRGQKKRTSCSTSLGMCALKRTETSFVPGHKLGVETSNLGDVATPKRAP